MKACMLLGIYGCGSFDQLSLAFLLFCKVTFRTQPDVNCEEAITMKRAGCAHDGKPPKKSRNECAIDAEIPQPAKETDCEGWLKLVGIQAFMDLKKREQRSLTALCREAWE
jgi:hypothetical protein